MSEQDLKGSIFNIQLNSTEDGPGIRTTVFLKGCPMHCPWCHNPEGIRSAPELVWYESRCIGDEKCVQRCPKGALSMTDKGMVIDRGLCDACGICVEACPANALEVLGKTYSVADVASIVIQDKVFYDKSGGGLTLSGGEPAMQPQFSAALMRAVKKAGIHITLDTCLGAGWNVLEPLVTLADLVLLDIKTMNEADHLRFTGISLQKVLDNAQSISRMGTPIWVRTPVIPGYTDKTENIRQVARFIREQLPTALRYDLLAFNKICEPKYARLEMPWLLEGVELLTEDIMAGLAHEARAQGLDFVHWSGMTRIASPEGEAALSQAIPSSGKSESDL